MKVGGHAVEHGTPAFRADGRNGSVNIVCDGTVRKDAVKIRRGCLSEKIAGTVNADESYPFVGVHCIPP